MVIHVGIDPFEGRFQTYNTHTDEQQEYQMQKVGSYEIILVEKMFAEVMSKINGNLGRACICLCYDYGNAIRKKFVTTGSAIGFEDVELMSWDIAVIINSFVQSNYEWKKGDLIRIDYEDSTWHTGTKSKKQTLPNVLFYKKNNVPNMKALAPNCQLFEIEPASDCHAALQKAQKLQHFNSHSGLNFTIMLERNILIEIGRSDSVPLTKNILLIPYKHGEEIRILKQYNVDHDTFESTKNRYNVMTGTTNVIYSTDGKNSKVGKITWKTDKKNEKMFEKIEKYNGSIARKTMALKFKADRNGLVTISEANKDVTYGPGNRCYEFYELFGISDETDFLLTYNKGFYENLETIKLPNFKEIVMKFSIDKNGIYSIEFENHEKGKNHRQMDMARFMADGEWRQECRNFIFPQKIDNFDSDINVIGIDLGTSRCCAAVNRRNGIQAIPLDNQGQRQLPSFVSFEEEKEKCGQVVIDRTQHFPKSSVFDAKRILGKNLSNIKADENWTFDIDKVCVILPDKDDFSICKDQPCIMLEDHEREMAFKFPEQISAVLLRHIKQKAEEYQGAPMTEAVITIPASFSDENKKATYVAAKLAGWKKIRFLIEPVAAAFAYFIDRPIPNNSTLLLFDLGGGTLDACIFKIKKNGLQVIGKNGDRNLGGRDFDNVLVEYFKDTLEDEHDIEISKTQMYKLMLKCQAMKESLSAVEETTLDVSDFDPSSDEFIPMTRETFEELSSVLLEKIKTNISKLLRQNFLDANEVKQVLEVGGGCRMPMIRRLCRQMFPNAEHLVHPQPDEVVAIGAAYYSYYLNHVNSVRVNHDRCCSVN